MDRLLLVAPADTAPHNHTQDSLNPAQDWVIQVVAARYIGDYQLRLSFSDGTERTVDFGPFLQRSSNPLIRKYLDIELFQQFSLAYGDLLWHDYDLCFPVADLYEGHIFHEMERPEDEVEEAEVTYA